MSDFLRTKHVLSMAELAAGRPLVERPGPGKAPTAFRIWAYGTNECDGKPVVFTERAAEALIAEQTARGRLYSFDYDHRSLIPDVSPEAGKAAGWHVLEVREYDGKPELWASQCDWTAEARAGVESTPPEWKYFSPCFEVHSETREVVSYINTALTNNPLTHGLPALASAVSRAEGAGGPRLFELHRDEDESGISGTGVVAEGVIYADGTVALRWKTETPSTSLFDSVDQVQAVHGHGGKTRLVYRSETPALIVGRGADGVAAATVSTGRVALSRARCRVLQLRSRKT